MVGPQTLRTFSLFSGIGGLDLGLERGCRALGLHVDAQGYLEREAFGAAVLVEAIRRRELSPAPVYCGDVRELDVGALAGRVELVLGGFPCQDISNAGSCAGIHGDRSALWFQVARVFREVGARYLFVENVRALTVRGLDVVLGTLADLGCAAEWTCLRASDIGAPHRRDRFFLLAERRRERLEGLERPGATQEATRRGSEPLEHAQGPERGPGGPGAQARAGAQEARRRGSAGAGAEMDDADSRGLRGVRELAAGPDALQPVAGRNLADPDRRRRGELRQPQPARQRRAPRCVPDRRGGAWPPAPGDVAGWERVLATRPDLAPALEPSFRGVAHGLPRDLDRPMAWKRHRLMALGNSVVPDQAAAAFVELWGRLHA